MAEAISAAAARAAIGKEFLILDLQSEIVFMDVSERVSKVERRVSTVEEAIQLLSQLIASHDNRLFDSLKKDEDMSEKITMLIDAQIRNEDKWQESEDKWQKNNEEFNAKMAILAETQAKNQAKNNEEFNAKMAVLAETQTKSSEELNAKIAILVDAQTRKRE